MRQPYNTDLSNKEGEIIAAMMPKPSKLGDHQKRDFREVLNARDFLHNQEWLYMAKSAT
jgi:hypothetical protein